MWPKTSTSISSPRPCWRGITMGYEVLLCLLSLLDACGFLLLPLLPSPFNPYHGSFSGFVKSALRPKTEKQKWALPPPPQPESDRKGENTRWCSRVGSLPGRNYWVFSQTENASLSGLSPSPKTIISDFMFHIKRQCRAHYVQCTAKQPI